MRTIDRIRGWIDNARRGQIWLPGVVVFTDSAYHDVQQNAFEVGRIIGAGDGGPQGPSRPSRRRLHVV